MAQVIENPKGFKVIKTTATECLKWGGMAVCDHCNKEVSYDSSGYFIAVLNHWVCPECYDKWLEKAILHKDDKPYESKIFKRYAKLLGLSIE